MIDPFFVTTKCSLPVKELAEKNALLAYTLLIYNKLFEQECVWFLGDCFSHVVGKMFNHARDMRHVTFHLYSS